MRASIILAILNTPLVILALPTAGQTWEEMVASWNVKPVPCVRNPAITAQQTQERAAAFVDAYLTHPDITKAFSYIAKDLVNHDENTNDEGGIEAYWKVKPFWNEGHPEMVCQDIKGSEVRVKYKIWTGAAIDRYRFDGGCIVEHFKMRASIILSALIAPLAVSAFPATVDSRFAIEERQAAPVKPAPCVRNPSATVQETEQRAAAFADAFIRKPDISKAFTFIAKDYINHNPSVKNGSDAAWEVLSPIWNQQKIKVLGTAFKSPQSWVNYQSDFGSVVDRFRWEGGCIVEHWDQNEVFPTNPTGTDNGAGPKCKRSS
ncbi:hypothetical protein KJE20_05406 [Pyrenophora tritici-repentis]|nr:hypothetical protein KJE20_05406 [Pyrenophora tritici-repentis]PWO24147.1 hypothetical protein PtrARCrB10_07312 [Pyrenophora tritici-repentis]